MRRAFNLSQTKCNDDAWRRRRRRRRGDTSISAELIITGKK